MSGCVAHIETPSQPTGASEGFLSGVLQTGGSIDLQSQYQPSIDDDTKADLARARRTHADTIRKGDYMMTKNNPKEALHYYM